MENFMKSNAGNNYKKQLPIENIFYSLAFFYSVCEIE